MATTDTYPPAHLAQLLRWISHELRTPLGTVAIWLRLCRDGADAMERARALDMIEESLDALVRIAGDLTECSALLESGRRLQGIPIGYGSLVSRVVEALRPRAERIGVALELEPAGEEIRVDMEPDRLARGLETLLWAAAAHRAPQRRLRVRIEADPEQARLIVPLENTAWPDIRPLSACLRDAGAAPGPSGLTLSIASEIIALHGGSVGLAVEPAGKALVIRLPRSAA